MTTDGIRKGTFFEYDETDGLIGISSIEIDSIHNQILKEIAVSNEEMENKEDTMISN